VSAAGKRTGSTVERALRLGDPAGPAASAPERRRARDQAAAAAARLAEHVAAAGLADVAYACVDSPLGTLTVAGTRRGLVRVAFPEESREDVLARIATRISPRIVEAPGRLDQVRRELDEYFAGARSDFELALDWSLIAGFARRVLRATAAIPYGGVLSYGEVAGEAGSPRGSRATGNALGANPMPIVIPCHRVLRSGGALGGYGGGPQRKRWLLELEGALAPSPQRRA
jgi:methylated-DNA-[protein]-cysteine S-methyltransferase